MKNLELQKRANDVSKGIVTAVHSAVHSALGFHYNSLIINL